MDTSHAAMEDLKNRIALKTRWPNAPLR